MSEIRSSYVIDDSRRPVFTPFEADMLRYLHISDCAVILKVWKEYWEFCPVCGAREDMDGYLNHKDRGEITC